MSRRELLMQLAAWCEDSGVDGIDWDALRDAKRQAWPVPTIEGDFVSAAPGPRFGPED